MKSLVLAATLMAQEPVFVMSEEHCMQLTRDAQMAVDFKEGGNTYQNYVRTLGEQYRYSKGKAALIIDNIIPYSLEVGYEYFHNEFDPGTPYAKIIYQKCVDNIGTSSK